MRIKRLEDITRDQKSRYVLWE